MKFTKMHGLGNDYIYLNCLEHQPDNLPKLARTLSHRHFGIGSDGLICLCPSTVAHFKMKMYNKDGSEGIMCGNGIRCLAKFTYDKGLTERRQLDIETLDGVKEVKLWGQGKDIQMVEVDMGIPGIFSSISVPVKEENYTVKRVNIGNAHGVVYHPELVALTLSDLGPALSRHPEFQEELNIEFVHVISRKELELRVWERGSGETMACGTGACASVVAAVDDGLVGRTVEVSLPGGVLTVQWAENNHLYMMGPAVTVFEGEISL